MQPERSPRQIERELDKRNIRWSLATQHLTLEECRDLGARYRRLLAEEEAEAKACAKCGALDAAVETCGEKLCGACFAKCMHGFETLARAGHERDWRFHVEVFLGQVEWFDTKEQGT